MSQTSTCALCNKPFLIIDQEIAFLTSKGLPLPTKCSACRQRRRLLLRGGERALYKTKCQKCGKDIVVSYDPIKTQNQILCREDYQKYTESVDPIITDPLPDLNL
jgi:hypothetical protein